MEPHHHKYSWEFTLNLPDFHGISASGAYEWNWQLGDRSYNGEGFNAYAGPAVTLGAYYKAFMVGVGGMGGIEYKFGIPLALALDWKPTLTYVTAGGYSGINGWGFYDFALSVRYAF
jgi:hypothetical protein